MSIDDRSLDEIFRSYLGGGEGGKERRAPFKFLDPYEAEDRDIFFGREEEVKELYKKYFASNLLLLYGESGTGKTSLLRCGLLSQIPASDILILHLKNSARPYESLHQELRTHLGEGYNEGEPTPGTGIQDMLKALFAINGSQLMGRSACLGSLHARRA